MMTLHPRGRSSIPDMTATEAQRTSFPQGNPTLLIYGMNNSICQKSNKRVRTSSEFPTYLFSYRDSATPKKPSWALSFLVLPLIGSIAMLLVSNATSANPGINAWITMAIGSFKYDENQPAQAACSVRSQCTDSPAQTPVLTLKPQPMNEALAQGRARQNTLDFKQRDA